MQRGVFSKPDPVAASMYYKRAAEAYMQCGEVRLERIHRIASADCQARQGAYATAAADYVRAAELVEESNEMSLEEQRNEASRLYLQAAENFTQMNEPAKAGKYRIKAAMAWTYGDDSGVLDKRTMVALEEAIEGYCPDLLNRHARYRQTGTSAFVNPEHPEPTPEDLQMAKHHLVTSSYAHEPVMELVYVFIENREYPSALYAAGAASAILEKDGISTLTLGRTFVVETILLLAMGDPVGAEQLFLNTHVQQTSYLSSRECRLAEDLFRAVLQRDGDALEETRSPHGPNRAALANLHPKARELVMQLRISGVAKKTSSTKKKTAPVAPIPQQEEEDDEFVSSNPETEAPPPSAAQQTDIDELHAEMDDLLNDMGLGSDTESEGEEDSDDDELDLR